MPNLITINGAALPEPASFNVSTDDKVNEFESESGKLTLDIVRKDIYSISVSYNGILEAKLRSLQGLLSGTVVNAGFYDTKTAGIITKRMRVRSRSQSKQNFKHGISVWSYSFTLEEV